MRVAYLLLNVEMGAMERVGEALIRIPEVTEVHSIAGEYDLLARVQVEEIDDFGEVVPTKIHAVPGIRDTLTLMSFKEFK